MTALSDGLSNAPAVNPAGPPPWETGPEFMTRAMSPQLDMGNGGEGQPQ
jgi:hypothetical protein